MPGIFDPVTCPYCGLVFEDNAEYVDVGFGGGRARGVQVTGNQCDFCGSTECGAYSTETSPLWVHQTGWFGPYPAAIAGNIAREEQDLLTHIFHALYEAGYKAALQLIERPANFSPEDSLAPSLRPRIRETEPQVDLEEAPF